MRNAIISLAIPFIAVFLFFAPKAFAITVGPPKLEISVDPGSTYSGKIFLLNEENETKTFYASFEKFTEVDGEKQFSGGTSELADWFQMPTKVTLAAKEQKYIDFSAKVPKDASPGGHYAVIWWSTAPSGSGSQILTRAGIVTYVRVSGDIKESGSIAAFDAEGKLFSGLPPTFFLLFKNTGNVHLKPSGSVLIKNIFGQTVESRPINQYGLEVLPQSERTFEITKQADKFALGFYTAIAQINFGDSNQTASARVLFFVFPWKTILLWLFAAAVVIAVTYFGIKKYNQWIIAKASQR